MGHRPPRSAGPGSASTPVGSGIETNLVVSSQAAAQNTCTGVSGVFTNGSEAPDFQDGHFGVVFGPAEVVRVLIHRALSLKQRVDQVTHSPSCVGGPCACRMVDI